MSEALSSDDAPGADELPERRQAHGEPAALASGLESGWLNLEVFDQGRWWLNRDGLPFRIASEMSPAYLANVVAFLEQGADYFHAMTVRRFLLTTLDPEPPAASAGMEHLRVAIRTDRAEAWLEETVLMQALRAALGRSGYQP